MLGKNLFSASSGMDANHSDTNGPRGVSNGHLEIGIISLKRKFRDQKGRNILFVQIFHLKYFTALHDVIFIHFLGMLKILLFPLFKQKKLKKG